MNITYKNVANLPRIPLEGSIDLTYRCNNHCRHCWLLIPDRKEVRENELTFDEIRKIVDEARVLGCRYWRISGGEPLYRPDFSYIFDYLTSKATGYTLNTNGTLLTPKIAEKLKRSGNIYVALYGSTAETYDYITRHPGGFEKAMQGFSYLKESNVTFTVQLIPMKANWHQWHEMINLAKTLSPYYRVGAPWLFLSSSGSIQRNREIIEQRLSPQQVIEADPPHAYYEKTNKNINSDNSNYINYYDKNNSSLPIVVGSNCGIDYTEEDHLFARCIEARREFHIDPYGLMSWCLFIKDPTLRYNLRTGSFQEAWETFIPSCSDKVVGGSEWRANCGSCEKQTDCRWCAVYAFLETGSYSAPVPYLCSITKASDKYIIDWRSKHRRFFNIAGITICLESDIDFDPISFSEDIKRFEVDCETTDVISLRHHFYMPDVRDKNLGQEIYRNSHWKISSKGDYFYFQEIDEDQKEDVIKRLAIFSENFSRGVIYNSPSEKEIIIKYGWHTFSLFPFDKFWLAPALSYRKALFINSAVVVVNGKGLLFLIHPDDKRSISKRLSNDLLHEKFLEAKILYDESCVIRLCQDGWRAYGILNQSNADNVTHSHAPLRKIIFLEQSQSNFITKLEDKKIIKNKFLDFQVSPIIKNEWCEKEPKLIEQIIDEVSWYNLYLKESEPILEKLTRAINYLLLS